MIKVNDVNKTGELNQSKAARRTSGGESFASYLNKTMPGGNSPVNASSNISVADAIFATQMINGEEERAKKQKMLKRGGLLLDKLEEIRDALLVGYIGADKLIEISRLVKENRSETDDVRLNEIMDEIELRVEVELAKLTK